MPKRGSKLSEASKLASAQGRAIGAIKEIQADAQREGAGGVVARMETAVYSGIDPLAALSAEARRLGIMEGENGGE